jgi:RNA polymerase sigma-70 factor (ECF subfamily)
MPTRAGFPVDRRDRGASRFFSRVGREETVGSRQEGDVAPPDPQAELARLYDAHAELVWKHLHRLGVRSADVPDLLQEVFLVLQRRWSEVRRDEPIEPLLWGIAAGLAANYRRRAFRRLEVLGASTESEPHAPRSEDDPERALDRRRTRARIEAALAALAPEHRAVFVMFELEALSGQEIARLLGVPVGTVHSRLFQARKELQRALASLAATRDADGRAP